MNAGLRRKVLLFCLLGAGVAAWGYAALSWWQNGAQRVVAPDHAGKNAALGNISNLPTRPALAPGDEIAPAEPSPELTPDENVAAERIAQVVEIAQEKWSAIALDGKSAGPDSNQFMQRYTAWIRDLYSKAFERCSPPNAPWRRKAAQWLDDYVASATDKESRASLREAGERLVDEGCDDWLVRYCLFRCQDANERQQRAAQAAQLLQPLDSLAASGYPPEISYRIYLAHAEAMAGLTPGQPVGLKQALDDWTKAISAPLTDEERQFYAFRYEADRRAILDEYLGQTIARLNAAPSADSWFVRLTQAIWHIKRGWELRGGGYAADVTTEGWSGFDAHLKKARVLLLQCWGEHSDCPDAAAQLIAVTMGIGGIAGEEPRFWFDEAVGAQFDCRDAYDRLRWALRPRWGGSHAEMLAFGRECLATERFDTDVPWQFHVALRDIGSELNDRRQVYRLKGVYDDYQRLLAGYRQRPDVTPALARLQESRGVCAAWLAGHYDEAKELFAKLGDNIAPEAFVEFETTLGEARRDVFDLGQRPHLANIPFLNGVDFVSLSHEGHALMVGSIFSGAQIADTTRGCEIIATLAPARQQAFRGLNLSASGTMLVTVPMPVANQNDTPSVLIWDVKTQSKLRELTMPMSSGPAFLATFSPDDRYVAVGALNGSLLIWDVSSDRPEPVFRSSAGHFSAVFGLHFSHDGRRLMTVGGDRRVLLWDLTTGPSNAGLSVSAPKTIEPFGEQLGGACLSPDGERLLVFDTDVSLWDVSKDQKLLTVAGRCGDFAPDGRRFVTGGGKLGTDGRVWDAESGEELLKLVGGHAHEMSLVVFSNDGRRILTGSTDPNNDRPGFVRCWDAQRGEEIFDFSGLE